MEFFCHCYAYYWLLLQLIRKYRILYIRPFFCCCQISFYTAFFLSLVFFLLSLLFLLILFKRTPFLLLFFLFIAFLLRFLFFDYCFKLNYFHETFLKTNEYDHFIKVVILYLLSVLNIFPLFEISRYSTPNARWGSFESLQVKIRAHSIFNCKTITDQFELRLFLFYWFFALI